MSLQARVGWLYWAEAEAWKTWSGFWMAAPLQVCSSGLSRRTVFRSQMRPSLVIGHVFVGAVPAKHTVHAAGLSDGLGEGAQWLRSAASPVWPSMSTNEHGRCGAAVVHARCDSPAPRSPWNRGITDAGAGLPTDSLRQLPRLPRPSRGGAASSPAWIESPLVELTGIGRRSPRACEIE